MAKKKPIRRQYTLDSQDEAVPILLTMLNPKLVREALFAVPVFRMNDWVQESFGRNLASRRSQAHAEFTKA